MFQYFNKMALMSLMRFKAHTFINVTSLVIGFTCFITAVTLSTYLDSFDRNFPRSELTYVLQETRQGASFDSSLPLAGKLAASHLRTAFPEIGVAVRAMPMASVDATADGHTTAMNVRYVEDGFLDIFPVPILQGAPAESGLAANAVLISENAARKRFGTTNVVGKRILLAHRVDVFIAGVMRHLDFPSHIESAFSALSSDLIAPIEIADRLQEEHVKAGTSARPDDWYDPLYYTFIQFRPGQAPDTATFDRKLAAFVASNVPKNERTRLTYSIIPVNRLAMATISGIFGGVEITTVLFIAGCLVLLMAALNYSNLVLAQLAQRTQEIGVQKICGSTRGLLIVQYSYESLLLVGTALTIAMLLSLLALGSIGSDGGTVRTALLLDGSLWLGLLIVSMVIIGIAGAYPALRTTWVSLATLLRTRSGARRSLGLRAFMVAMQFVICSTLIVLSLVMFKQNGKMAQQLDGETADPKVAITTPLNGLPVDPDALAAEMGNHPGIVATSRTAELPWSLGGFAAISLSRSSDPGARNVQIMNHMVAKGFAETLEVPFVAGRSFVDGRATEELPQPTSAAATAGGPYSIIIDEMAARRLGWENPAAAVGQRLYVKYEPPRAPQRMAIPVEVIGVTGPQRFQVMNFATFGIGGNAYTLQPALANHLVIRIDRRQLPGALGHIDTVWKRFLPQVTLKRNFFDELFASSYRVFLGISAAMTALSALGFVVAGIGLLGNATFVIQGRRKEVGIRKVLGASPGRLLAMLIKDFAKPVVIANVIAWPIAFVLAKGYLSLFPQQASISFTPFLIALVICVAVTCLSVLSQSWKSARIRPATVLRSE